MTESLLFLVLGMLFMYQWILGKHWNGSLYIRKQWREHECMNSYMDGTYDCPYCYPEDYTPENHGTFI